MTDRDMTRAEVEAWISEGPSHGVHINNHALNRMVRQLLRCMKERNAARGALMNAGAALHVAKREAEAAEAENARLRGAEKELSDAYLRIRAKLNAYDTKPGGTDRFDVTEAALDAVLAEVARLREALFWCSGSDDFNEGGFAREGWLKLCAPLLTTRIWGGFAIEDTKPAPTITTDWPIEEGEESVIVGETK